MKANEHREGGGEKTVTTEELFENLAIKQLRELMALAQGSQATAPSRSPYIGRQVIVRSYSAGVHYGTVLSHDGKQIELANTKRIWRWFGEHSSRSEEHTSE